ncbi:MAG: glycosyltransferase family 2 protein [Bacteroidetes bacterium]|nr:glycosyltransferase family 2 protein [Bacteroidota bacterium]MCL2302519.1 glycosyltransferase family 2 protein [Lentimicrobiaceae bacterium]
MKKIAVLIPCYNEEKTIRQVVTDFKEALPDATIYVYDNNSTDRTAEIATEAGATVRYEYQQGKGNVIRSMFRQIDADCYLMIDGDDTYPAKHAREMVDLVLEKGVDMVIGDRLSSTYFEENKRPFHNFGNKLVRYLINFIWKAKVKDVMTGYRAFSKPFVKMFPVMSGGFEIETEMTIHALDKRFFLREIEIDYRDRPEGSFSKLDTHRDGIKVIKTIFSLFKEYSPLKFFGWIAAFLLLIAIGLFIPILITYIETGLVPRFPTLIASCFFALASLHSFFAGLILDNIIRNERKTYELKRNTFK